jgi:predicted ATPase
MRITEIKITNFRSIVSLQLKVRELVAICGLNSCGKSNVMRALRFAFIPEYSQSRMADNLCNRLNSPNAACKVTLKFDEPTAGIADVLGIPRDSSFAFSVAVKKNGVPSCHVNGVKVSDDIRQKFVNQILVVHVPPIRDIAAEGLAPFKATLAQALRNTRNGAGSQSFVTLANNVRSAVEEKGRVLLGSLQELARNMLRVDDIAVDASGLDLESLLPSAALKVSVSGSYIGLDKLGTGHQSSVILQLYRQLGQAVDQFVLYLFEEPDNHLHPTSMRAIAAELAGCARENNAQVFLTTHSPHLLNQFDLRDLVALRSEQEKGTVVCN